MTTSRALLGPIRQTAFLVDDVEAEARRWVDVFGVGPFFVFEIDIPGATYRGELAPLGATVALAQTGGQQIELIQPRPNEPSIYREFLDAGGSGVHHVCYWADIEQAIDRLEKDGCELVQDGLTAGGDRFCYLTSPIGVPYVELVDPSAGKGQMRQFFARVADAAEDWDGAEPIRRR